MEKLIVKAPDDIALIHTLDLLRVQGPCNSVVYHGDLRERMLLVLLRPDVLVEDGIEKLEQMGFAVVPSERKTVLGRIKALVNPFEGNVQ